MFEVKRAWHSSCLSDVSITTSRFSIASQYSGGRVAVPSHQTKLRIPRRPPTPNAVHIASTTIPSEITIDYSESETNDGRRARFETRVSWSQTEPAAYRTDSNF